MYEKNLSERFIVRFSKTDLDFLNMLAVNRSVTPSDILRSIVGDYRRSFEREVSDGNIQSNIDNQL